MAPPCNNSTALFGRCHEQNSQPPLPRFRHNHGHLFPILLLWLFITASESNTSIPPGFSGEGCWDKWLILKEWVDRFGFGYCLATSRNSCPSSLGWIPLLEGYRECLCHREISVPQARIPAQTLTRMSSLTSVFRST